MATINMTTAENSDAIAALDKSDIGREGDKGGGGVVFVFYIGDIFFALRLD
jgi:hypothetical protein